MTDIEWTDESWNPIRARLRSDHSVIGWHCEHASPGCENCYSETRNRSGRCNMGTKLPFKPGHRKDVEIYIDEAQLLKPLSWRKGRAVFVCSMTDLFADFVTDDMLDRLFAVMALCPQHTFQVLTKRSARMREYMTSIQDGGERLEGYRGALIEGAAQGIWYDRTRDSSVDQWLAVHLPLPNVWLGVSVEDQQRADERIPDLLATPAAVRWISAEPLLGPVNIIDAMWARDAEDLTATISWVVAGGESGPGARAMHPDWARSLRDQCAAADVAFFFKQWGDWFPYGELDADGHQNSRTRGEKPGVWHDWKGGEGFSVRIGKKQAGRLLDGVEHNGMPGRA